MGCSLSRFKRTVSPVQVTVQGDDEHRTLNDTQQKRSSSAWSRFFSSTTAHPTVDSDTDNLNQQHRNPQSASATDIHATTVRADQDNDRDHDQDPSEVSGVAVHLLLVPFLVSTTTHTSTLAYRSTQLRTAHAHCTSHRSLSSQSTYRSLSFCSLTPSCPVSHRQDTRQWYLCHRKGGDPHHYRQILCLQGHQQKTDGGQGIHGQSVSTYLSHIRSSSPVPGSQRDRGPQKDLQGLSQHRHPPRLL